MKLRLFTVLSSGASAIVLSSAAHAAYTGLSVEFSNSFFDNHPNPTIRNAWLAGPSSQYYILRLYANFNSNTPADRVNAAYGHPSGPLELQMWGCNGTFHNYTEDPHGKTLHFNLAYTGQFPPERSWDTYVTIGNAINGGETLLTPGFEVETNNLGFEADTIGPSGNVAWVIPETAPQGQAVAAAPGQANAPPGVYRVLLAQITVPKTLTFYEFKLKIDVNGSPHLASSFLGPIYHPGDTNGDGCVDIADLLNVINNWGPCEPTCPALACLGDEYPPSLGDCYVDVQDLLMVIDHWTP